MPVSVAREAAHDLKLSQSALAWAITLVPPLGLGRGAVQLETAIAVSTRVFKYPSRRSLILLRIASAMLAPSWHYVSVGANTSISW